MIVQVRFFAALRERVGHSEEQIDLPAGATVGELWQRVSTVYPAVAPMAACMSFAVNREYADRETGLRAGDEVALIPPVSGG